MQNSQSMESKERKQLPESGASLLFTELLLLACLCSFYSRPLQLNESFQTFPFTSKQDCKFHRVGQDQIVTSVPGFSWPILTYLNISHLILQRVKVLNKKQWHFYILYLSENIWHVSLLSYYDMSLILFLSVWANFNNYWGTFRYKLLK